MPNLIVLSGPRKGVVIPVDRPILIGRSEPADLRLPDFLVSTEHARVEPDEEGLVLEDLSSTNGTFRNGARVHERTQLRVGDVLHIGTTDLLISDHDRYDPALLEEVAPPVLAVDVESETAVSTRAPSDEGTVVLPLLHLVERAFSAAPDLSNLIERIALYTARAARARIVTVLLQHTDDVAVVRSLRVEGGTVSDVADDHFERAEVRRASLARAPHVVVSEQGWTLYAPLLGPKRILGAVVASGEASTPPPEGGELNQAAITTKLAALHVHNHMLVDALRERNSELEQARARLATWNESLEAKVQERAAQARRSEHSYRELFEGALEGHVTVDRAGTIVTCNAPALEILGPDAVSGSLWERLGAPGVRALRAEGLPFQAWLERLARGPAGELIQFPLQGGGGERHVELLVRPIAYEGAVEGLHAVVRDVTERHRTEQQMRLLSRVVESSPEAIVCVDLEGRVTSWNPGAERLYGYARADVEGEILPVIPDERVAEFERLLAAAAEGRTCTLRSVRASRDDRQIPVVLTVAPVPGPDGAIEGVVEIARDNTGQLEREEALRWRERISSFADVAAGLGHELGNPLANLSSGVELLLSEPPGPEESQKVLEVLRVELQRLRRLVSETLNLDMWRRPERRETRTGGVLQFVATAIGARAREAGVEVALDLGDDVAFEADVDQLQQALLNLCSNALEAMPDGGTLTLSASADDAWVTLRVDDTGPGIDPEHRERIFDLYYTRRAGGSGIGLAIVRRVADMHRGRVTLESEPGCGASFRLDFPRGEA